MATGDGLVTVLTLDGVEVGRRETSLQIVTVTGALVDDDDTLDLLISTMQGELVAWSGRTMSELWRIRLGSLGGPAVATDVDGDGSPEIVVVTSDERLLVVAPRREPASGHALPGDTDGDGMTDADELRLGLQPDVPDAHLDSDGDGLTNGAEVAAGSHPRGLWTSYLPGGVTSTFFSTTIALANPSATNRARVVIRLQDRDGHEVRRFVEVPPQTRSTVSAADAFPAFATAEFATMVESDVPLAVDGTQTWGTPTDGAAAERGNTEGPGTTWYLAEGATHGGFDLFYMIHNPGSRQAELVITFLRPVGQSPVTWRGSIEAGRRFTLHVNAVSGLESTEVAGIVTVVNGTPVLVERLMFLTTSDGRIFRAGHQSAAVKAPALDWFLAEGATGPYFDTFVLIANPSAREAVVDVTFLRPAGPPIVHRLVIPAATRHTIWVDQADPALAHTAVSTRVVAVNGVGVVVERAMWWPGTNWQDGHASTGETRPGTAWAFAEGAAGGQRNAATFLLVANPAEQPALVRLRLLFEDGTTASRMYWLPPDSRTSLSVRDEFPDCDNRRFGVLLESMGPTSTPVVLERAMYWDGAGITWASGTAALATRLH